MCRPGRRRAGAGSGGPNLGETGVVEGDESVHVEAVPHLGDKAFLLTGKPHRPGADRPVRGAVLTVDLGVHEEWAGSDGPPENADGYLVQPPGLNRHHPALTAAMRHLMTALSA